jgi:hypothetical protein
MYTMYKLTYLCRYSVATWLLKYLLRMSSIYSVLRFNHIMVESAHNFRGKYLRVLEAPIIFLHSNLGTEIIIELLSTIAVSSTTLNQQY